MTTHRPPIILTSLCILTLCLMASIRVSTAAAGTYYVSNSGKATWSEATNINAPTDVQTAFNNAVAGDVVYFRGGTYNVPPKNFGDTYRGYYEPKNSGSDGNPITFQAYPGEYPIFNGTSGGTGDSGICTGYATIFGVCSKSYITVDGFTFKTDGGAGSARIILGCQSGMYNTSFITVKNSIFYGGKTITCTDNSEGIRAEQASDITISNCTVVGYRETNNNHNRSGFKEYNTRRIVLINNEYYNNTAAIYLKRECLDCTISYNYIHNNYLGIFVTPYNAGTEFDCNNLRIYHNVVSLNSYQGIQIYTDHGENAYADNAQIYNNTIYNSDTTNNNNTALSFIQGRSLSFYNNIIYGSKIKTSIGDYVYNSIATFDYNQYGNLGSFLINSNLYGSGGTQTYASRSIWQSALIGGGAPISPDVHSMDSNPLFTNGSGNYSLLSDFKLQSNSPCRGTGKGGADMGANVDFAGVRNGRKAIAAPPNAR